MHAIGAYHHPPAVLRSKPLSQQLRAKSRGPRARGPGGQGRASMWPEGRLAQLEERCVHTAEVRGIEARSAHKEVASAPWPSASRSPTWNG